jgi:3-oxoadipate enol-lactonase
MPTAFVNNQHIHYLDTGGDGPVVVFSHGNLMDADMWQQQIAQLAADYRCIAWDARLHGRTEDDGAPYTYWDSADDLLGLLDHLGIERANLAGHSQGGFVSLRAALRAPERVSSLVLVDTMASAWPAETRQGIEAERDGMRDPGPQVVGPPLLDLLLGDRSLSPQWLTKWEQQPRTRLAHAVDTLLSVDAVEHRLTKITAPALVIHGEVDQAIPVSAGRALHAGLPGAMDPMTVIPGAAHTPPLTHPDEVNAAIAGFLAGHV